MQPSADLPLVSIGIPTYNRAERLVGAIDSALAQDYPNLEVVISDNASSDGTEALCRAYAARDARVRYIRQPRNVGPSANFDEVLLASRGAYFMWLADDDRIEPAYVSRCAQVLTQHQDHILVGGRAMCWSSGQFVLSNEPMTLAHASPVLRVLTYFSRVRFNGIFYGVMRKECLPRSQGLADFCDDWLMIGAMAYRGKVRTLDDVAIHRELGGASANLEKFALKIGMSKRWAACWRFVIAWTVFRGLLHRSRWYDGVPRPARLFLAVSCFLIVFWRIVVLHQVERLRGRLQLRTRINRLRGKVRPSVRQ